MVGFDRAGYGESDPNPNRSVRSAASDLTELADALDLGPKFYLVGFSLGNHAVWGALKYFPERLVPSTLHPLEGIFCGGYFIRLATANQSDVMQDCWGGASCTCDKLQVARVPQRPRG